MDDYLAKPVRFVDLAAMIARLIPLKAETKTASAPRGGERADAS